ncbi:SusC/RagA family TonB-linked outer membrane protein [Flavobacterium eburneipallidum]|uniref:SusC/RagA family TonB-linked outer membrane protein n=1 Tax=Flavobacterium eburneipallidum TaxID=3003263 RepID=UPI002482FEDD|nr:SusC/RagA family TonB-linked outer membrane protein [Flavobacterium eburneipallidum]
MKLKFNGFLVLFAVLMVQITFAQERVVTGVVSDNSGLPLPGVSVLVKGTQTSAQSDFDGKYFIKATPSQVLVFSFIGMKTQEVTASSSQINIKLLSSEEQLSEVVVTAVGIKREKASIGSAQTTIKSEKLNQGAQTNVADALKGKVAGVVISNASTDPGASSGVIIRGFSSMSGSNQPLYVVDGIPINDESNFSDALTGGYDFGRGSGDINPNDIETLTVLKGASATALYGSRAANGAIIITTKKGKSGKISVDVTSTMSFSEILRTPKYQSTFGQGWDGSHYLIENGSWGPKFDNQPRVWGNVVDNSQLLKPFSFQKDQLENFFDTGISKINSIAISGGSESSTARLSYSNTQQDGIYPTDADSFGRHTLALTASTKVNKFSFSGNLNYVKTSGSGVATGQGLSLMNNLMQIPTDIPITEFRDYKGAFHNIDNYYTPYGITNPYFTLNEDGSDYSKNRVYGSVDVSYEINKWSNITYRFGLDHSNDLLKRWVAKVDASPGSPNDGSSTEQAGSYAEISQTLSQYNHDILYSLDFDLGSNFKLASTFGWNMNERHEYLSDASVGSQDIAGFHSFSNSSQNPTVTSEISKRKLYGIYNSSTLSYDNQLFLTTNIRNDWYSTLPKENQSVLYGGLNTSWVFTNTFPAIKKIISYGKLRAGYGETGVDTAPYQIGSVYVAGTTDNQGFAELAFPLNGVNGYEVGNRAANPFLKPEIRKEYEVGAELSFFKSRINLDFAYYNAKVENQILSLPLAPSSGYTSQTANIGTLSNKGIEALLSVLIIKNSNNGFNWTTTLNYAKNNTILEELDPRIAQVSLGGLSTTSFIAREGQPVGLIYGSVPLRDPNGNIVVDSDGIPVASPDKEVYGDTQYDYTLGVGNTFTYKNFTLDFSFDIRQGGLMYSRTAEITRFTGNSITTTYNDRNPFIVPNSVVANTDGAGNVTYTPNTTPVDNEHMDNYYSAVALDRENVIDKSFVKLREVVLSYNLPSNILKGTGLNNLTVSIIGRNLFLWTPASNQYIDPEASTFGTDLEGQFGEFSANPSTRSLGFSLKANF